MHKIILTIFAILFMAMGALFVAGGIDQAQYDIVWGMILATSGIITVFGAMYMLFRRPISRLIMLLISIYYLLMIVSPLPWARKEYGNILTNPELKETFILLGIIGTLCISNIVFLYLPGTKELFKIKHRQ